MRRYLKTHKDFTAFPQQVAIQLNDTHPAVAVAELMRVLVDEKRVAWDEAWNITVATFGYTNHTLLAEALEVWPLSIFERILPRHLEIIYEAQLSAFCGKCRFVGRSTTTSSSAMSIIEEGTEKKVRMAHLLPCSEATAWNGVAALHTELLRKDVLPDFAQVFPGALQQQDERGHAPPLVEVGAILGCSSFSSPSTLAATG